MSFLLAKGLKRDYRHLESCYKSDSRNDTKVLSLMLNWTPSMSLQHKVRWGCNGLIDSLIDRVSHPTHRLLDTHWLTFQRISLFFRFLFVQLTAPSDVLSFVCMWLATGWWSMSRFFSQSSTPFVVQLVRSVVLFHLLSIFWHEKFCRKYDYESYLATLMLKQPDVGKTGFAIRALNVEVAQVQDVTSNPAIALARFSFWYDVLEDLYSESDGGRFSGNPVAKSLKEVSIRV